MQFEQVTDLWEASRERYADRVALVGTRNRFTYREVGELVDAAAGSLRDDGGGTGV